MFNTGEKLATIQEKIHTIQDRLEANKLCKNDDEINNGYCGVSYYSWKIFLSHQTFYAHVLKIVILFSVAIAHLIYLQSFLDSYTALEEYNNKIFQKYPHQKFSPHGIDTRIINRQMEILSEYKKNIWMTVSTMCISLSTSCIFVFIIPITNIKQLYVNMIKIIDIISYSFIPILLFNRSILANTIHKNLQTSLQISHKIVNADKLMNKLICTIHYRDNIKFCSNIILDSIFPIVLLKYLFILTILTLAYIALAYLIEYCIKHWFPPYIYNDNEYSTYYHQYPSKMSSERNYHNKVYMPVILPPKNPLIHA